MGSKIRLGLFTVFSFALWLVSAQADELLITQGYARETPPGMTTSAIYLTLKNPSNINVRLVGVTSDRATQVMIHQNQQQGDMMRMRSVSQIEIAARSQFSFEPGGYHLMLTGLTHPLRDGEQVALRFLFEQGGVLDFSVPVTSLESEHQTMEMGIQTKAQHSQH